MPNEIIAKKLDQIEELLRELAGLLARPFDAFRKDTIAIRASERDFQLIVDLASDINTQILVERGKKTPDTYRQSFTDLEREDVLDGDLARKLTQSAMIRNILVHEYDFEEDYEKFYGSAKALIPTYREYIKTIAVFIRK